MNKPNSALYIKSTGWPKSNVRITAITLQLQFILQYNYMYKMISMGFAFTSKRNCERLLKVTKNVETKYASIASDHYLKNKTVIAE